MIHLKPLLALSIGLVALWPAARCAAAEPAPLRIGAAAASIAADDSMQIAGGIGPQYYHGQEGELRAVATVIEQPGVGKFAIVACDVIGVRRQMFDQVAGQIEKECGIAPIISCCTPRTITMPPAPSTHTASTCRKNSSKTWKQRRSAPSPMPTPS